MNMQNNLFTYILTFRGNIARGVNKAGVRGLSDGRCWYPSDFHSNLYNVLIIDVEPSCLGIK